MFDVVVVRERVCNLRRNEPVRTHQRIGNRGIPQGSVAVAARTAQTVIRRDAAAEAGCRQTRIKDRTVKICDVTAEVKFRFFFVGLFNPVSVRTKRLIFIDADRRTPISLSVAQPEVLVEDVFTGLANGRREIR